MTTTVQFIELLPGARQGLKKYAQVKEGEQVLIVGDTLTVDPWVMDAMAVAATEYGAKPTLLILPPAEKWVDEWPKIAVVAMSEADILVRLGGRSIIHSGIRETAQERGRTFIVKGNVRLREELASEYGKYPLEILGAVASRCGNRIVGKRKYNVTDKRGTDVRVEIPDIPVGGAFSKVLQPDYKRELYIDWPGATLGFMFSSERSNGVIVASATHFGAIPEIKMEVKNGQVVHIEGGGGVGQDWRRLVEKYKNTNFGKRPGPGINWLEEIMWGLHPKAPLERPSVQGPVTTLSSRSPRVIHLAMGAGAGTGQHRDVEIEDPTVTVDGEILIDNGRLVILDDPQVRAMAEQFGDPDELLKELA
jgi:2,5-dihydroxypyridine 5,6-dioxygenase